MCYSIDKQKKYSTATSDFFSYVDFSRNKASTTVRRYHGGIVGSHMQSKVTCSSRAALLCRHKVRMASSQGGKPSFF